MKLLIVLPFLCSTFAFAQFDVIYGEDHRQEVYEAPALHQTWASSTATMVAKEKVKLSGEGLVTLDQTTLNQWMSGPSLAVNPLITLPKQSAFCSDMKYIDQPNAGSCSGFLIAPDLLVTAGHCLTVKNFCEDQVWVFDYKVDPVTKTAGVNLPAKNVYGCKRIVSMALNMTYGFDYGVVQLERAVEGRRPLRLSLNRRVQVGTELVVIGSPSGLPLKVAGGAKVRNTEEDHFFNANLDTFEGNSGSAVFNAVTGEVEGILVRGEDDFETNPRLMCMEAKKCLDNECRGEDVSRLSSVPELALFATLVRASEEENLPLLKQLVDLGIWIDINLADGQSAFLKAAAANRLGAMKLLYSKGAELTKRDAEGNTALHLLAKSERLEVSEAVAFLLSAGVSREMKNNAGETALDVAQRLDHGIAVLALTIE